MTDDHLAAACHRAGQLAHSLAQEQGITIDTFIVLAATPDGQTGIAVYGPAERVTASLVGAAVEHAARNGYTLTVTRTRISE